MMTNKPGTDLVPATPAASDGSPFQRATSVSRRAVLAGMLGLGMGAFLDTSPLTSWTAYAAKPKSKPKAVADGTGPTQPGPYTVTASSELSDDVFATNDVLIGADDVLLPFYNPFSKADEALVRTGSSLSHLRRDPTQASGWAYSAFDLQGVLTDVISVAVAANNGNVYVLIVGDPDEDNNPQGSPYWLTWLDDAVTWDEGFIAAADDPDYPPGAGPITGGISADGVPYFYSSTVSGTEWSLLCWVTTGAADPLDFRSVLTIDTSASGYGPVQDCTLLYDTADGSDTVGYALVLYENGNLSVYPQQGKTFSTIALPDAGSTGVSELMWAWATPGSTTGLPGYAIQANVPGAGGEGTYFCDEHRNFDRLADLPGSGANVVSVWLADDLYTVNLLDSNGVLQTVQQSGPGAWAAPMPLTNGVAGSPKPGLAALYGIATDPTQSTLFAIGADESLSVLSLDASGWTQTQIHQDDVVAAQLTCYRLTINVVDANGIQVRYGQAQLDTDRPVGLWQDIGSTIVVPSTPVTMTGDLSGQIIVSVPAEEMDTAQLTVQAVNPDGSLSAAQAVIGDYDVRNFLNGSAALNDLGTLSGPTLQSAQNPDGSPLFPGLSAGNASGVSSLLGQAINAGNGTPPAASAVKAVRLQRHGKSWKLTTSHDAKSLRLARSEAQLGLSLSGLFDRIGHSLRHAMAVIENTVIHWADDAGAWLVDLELTINGAVVSFADLVISDMKDAFHVIGGLFTTLGADIKKAVTWLKREILGFLSSVGANATTIGNVLTAGPANLISIINGIERQVDGWFHKQETTVAGWFTNLETEVEEATFGSSQPLTTPPSDTGSATASSGLTKDIHWIVEVVNNAPGKWLYDKLTQYLPQDPGPDLDGVFDTVVNDLANVFKGSVDLAWGIGTSLWDSLQDLTTPGKVTKTKMTDWFSDMNGVTQDVLDLCDTIADTVLDFIKAGLTILSDYLSYEWSLTSINPILKLVLDELGYDPKISLERLVSLVVAFPVTLIRTILGMTPVFSTSTALVSDAKVGGGKASDGEVGDSEGRDSIASFFYFCATVSQCIWTIADMFADLSLVMEEGASKRPQAPGIYDYFDILCPILETIFLLPGYKDELIWTGFPTDANVPGLIAPATITAVATPIFKIVQKAGTIPTGESVDPDVLVFYNNAPAMKNSFAQYYAPIVSTIAGLANTALACAYSIENSSSAGSTVDSIIGTVLGNLSNEAAILTTWYLNESDEFAPVAVKLGIDAVGGFGAAISYAVAAHES